MHKILGSRIVEKNPCNKNVYFNEIYKLYLENFAKFRILVEINTGKYGEFNGNRKVHLFGNTPLMGFDSFFFLNLIFPEK